MPRKSDLLKKNQGTLQRIANKQRQAAASKKEDIEVQAAARCKVWVKPTPKNDKRDDKLRKDVETRKSAANECRDEINYNIQQDGGSPRDKLYNNSKESTNGYDQNLNQEMPPSGNDTSKDISTFEDEEEDIGIESDVSEEEEEQVVAPTTLAMNIFGFGKEKTVEESYSFDSGLDFSAALDQIETKPEPPSRSTIPPKQNKQPSEFLLPKPKPQQKSKVAKAKAKPRSKSLENRKKIAESRGKSKERVSNAVSKFKDAKHVYYEDFGEPTVLRMGKVMPNIGLRNAVVVRVEASTISISDCEIRRNINRNYIWPVSLPITPGQDLVGRIVHLGDKVQKYENFKVGERVCSLHQFLGGNTRYITLKPDRLVRVPESIEPTKAACIVRSYLAAYQILYRTGAFEIEKGHRILVTGANGNIGRAVIDLAKSVKARVYGAASSHQTRFVQHKLGVPYVHADPKNWSHLTDLDIVVDCVNYTGNFNDSKKVLGNGGVLVCVGSSKYVSKVMRKQKTKFKEVDYENDSDEELHTMISSKMCGAFVPESKKQSVYQSGCLTHLPLKCDGGVHLNIYVTKVYLQFFDNIENHWEACKDDLEYLFAKFLKGKINPMVGQCVTLNHIPKAQKVLESGGLQGTIICCPFMSTPTTGSQKKK